MGAEILAWHGSAADGRVVLRAPVGGPLVFSRLADLVAHLHERGDAWGGCVRAAAGLGLALQAMAAALAGQSDLRPALEEGAALVAGLPVQRVVEVLLACHQRHADLVRGPEAAARLVLEARRLQRTQEEAVARAVELAGAAVPSRGPLLLAWPGGPGCDLGQGLGVGAVLAAARRQGEILVAGPSGLANEAVGRLVAAGHPARAVADEQALAQACRAPLGGLVVRCAGDGQGVEPLAAALAVSVAGRNLPVLALGIRDDDRPRVGQLPPRVRVFLG